MSKKTPIEEMTREQLVQSAAQYKNLYNKAKIKLEEMTGEAEERNEKFLEAEAMIKVLQDKCTYSKKAVNELESRLKDACAKNARQADTIVAYQGRIQRIKADIEIYNDLPWWKRIFKKMHTSE